MNMASMQNWEAIAPELALVGGAIALLLVNIANPRLRGIHLPLLTLLALAVSAFFAMEQWGLAPAAAMADMVVSDRIGVFVRLVIIGAAAATTLVAPEYLRRRGLDGAEFYVLLLLSCAGMTLLTISADLIMVFLAVELLSLALYIMAGFERGRLESQEAAMKYFLLGAFGSAFLLYGIAFVFGVSGTTNLIGLREAILEGGIADFRLFGVAMALLVVGLGFKASLVPFHMWTPDVYQGSPTPVTAFMAGATKAAAFAAVLRIFVVFMGDLRWEWQPVIAAVSVVTLGVGALLAIAQTDIKRMLAYSSVAHAGFLGIAVVAASLTGIASALLYLLVYTAMTFGAFACVMLFREQDAERVHLAKYSGLGARRPVAAGLFAFFLFSLAGIPPTGGFFAKFYVFIAAIRADYAWLAVVGVAASVVAAFFYIRVAVVMFMQDPPEGDDMPLDPSIGLRIAIAVCALIVLAAGLAPGVFLDLAERAIQLP